MRGGGELDDLLVAALDGAVALEQVDRVALPVGKDLHLDVPRPPDGLLDEDRGVTEGRLRLAHRGPDRLPQRRRVVHPAHAAASATGDRLDEDREADHVRLGGEVVQVGRRLGGLQGGDPGAAGRVDGVLLVAGHLQGLLGGADEGDAVRGAGLGEVRVLREEAVARVDRVGLGLLGRPDDLLDVEVGADRVALLADHVGLVRLDPVHRIAVLVREHGDGPRPEFDRGAERTDSDFATVGDQDLLEHAHTFAAEEADGRVTDTRL
ncbi:hypothetical protein SDC9_74701 [bioreactor metagenome]|uniref:Uncharacterized protein n=1 Tax=bioreactor metagenome TaxID=1076179 RepID=A0A644YHT5_9ZZZZ